jgi:predicted metal-dependent peptidase
MADKKDSTKELTAEQSKEIRNKLMTARVNLILNQPFFGTLALRLRLTETYQMPTAATDGKHMYYNPHFVNRLNLKELAGLICHEVMHCACGHVWREKGVRFPKIPKLPANTPATEIEKVKKHLRHEKANIAMDFAINPLIKSCGLTLPGTPLTMASKSDQEGHLDDPKFHGMSWEEIYHLLPDPKVEFKQGAGGPGDLTINIPGQQPRMGDVVQPKGSGEDKDAQGNGGGDTDQEQENDWRVAANQAAQAARTRGKLPSNLEQFITEMNKPKVDWKALLRKYIQDHAKNDYSWRQPSPRYTGMGLYLPKLYSEELGPMAVAQDTSGSMWSKEDLTTCASELRSIIEDCKPQYTDLYYCDAAVAGSQRFERGEPFEFRPKGGGGTDFRPVFDEIAKQAEQPLCLIYFTDLQGTFPDEPPPYPVIWLTVYEGTAPFGETLKIEKGDL